jgi:hypothetical protein
MISENSKQQNHLKYKDRINMGSYYTQGPYVDLVWKMIDDKIDKETTILDSSCGYGNFFKNDNNYRQIGVDIDDIAICKAKNIKTKTQFFVNNSLENVSRQKYKIDNNDNLCIIGNPPYNDRTSIIRGSLKKKNIAIDDDIQTRDLGMSFLLSYKKLNADVVCVLHPLSYLIKPANFKLLKNFTTSYKLIKGTIISSGVFADSSKTMHFPIVIALYIKDKKGTNYNNILNFKFTTTNGKSFKINDFDYINNYVRKYPNKIQKYLQNSILFWTLRDINALKRNQTFVRKYSTNTIIIDRKKLDYYIYIDVLKQFSHHIPYYLGNCDVIINNDLFKKYRKYFILNSLVRHEHLRQYFAAFDFSKTDVIEYSKQKITEYFKTLLGVHYVN